MPVSIEQYLVGVEHIVAENTRMTGVLPEKNHPKEFIDVGGSSTDQQNRSILTYARPDDGGDPDAETGSPVDGNGLIDFWDDAFPVLNYRKNEKPARHPWLMELRILADDDVSWDVFITSGLRDGSPTELDDPSNDTHIGAGLGSGHLKPYIELLPYQCVRIVTTTAPTGTEIRALTLFADAGGWGGRFM